MSYSNNPAARGVKIAAMTLAGLAGVAVMALAFGWFVQQLWNWLMPSIFGLIRITFWQAFGLVFLAHLIFGTIGRHHRCWGRYRGRVGHWHHEWDWDDEGWRGRDGWKNWCHYDAWWKAEGKASFQSYIDRIQAEKEGKTE
jgi:hypothetical protein